MSCHLDRSAVSTQSVRSDSVNKVTSSASYRDTRRNRATKNTECYRCGEDHDPKKCRYLKAVCHSCNKVGHLARKCRSDNKKQWNKPAQNITYVTANTDTPELGVYTVGTCNVNGTKPMYVSLEVCGKSVKMQLDTGSAKSLIPESLHLENFANLKLDHSDVMLRTYNNEPIEHVGRLTCDVNYNGQSAQLSALIVKGDKMPLLGRDWITVLKLDWANIFTLSVNEQSSVKSVLDKHSAIFEEGMGTMKGHKAHIYMKDNAHPKFHKARPVPYI